MAASAALAGWRFVRTVREDDLKPDLLEGELFAGAGEEAEGKLIRLELRAELNLDRLVRVLGKRIGHLSVEDE